ncbi:MAG: phosphoglucomutase/phosphomannomutase family protein, partial [Candidatus Omnitrophica bacterium]|nr:phosphoglucomutase/phosphomannomutase family protein [Candidatus Omnitrophota bacterium]
IGFKNYLPERDGMLGGLLLLEMVIAENKSLEQLVKDTHREFGSYFYLRKDLKCAPSEKGKIRTRLAMMRKRKTFLAVAISKVKDSDGLKFHLKDGSWILFRLSGTEPILRIYAEADKLSRTRRLIAEGARWIRN